MTNKKVDVRLWRWVSLCCSGQISFIRMEPSSSIGAVMAAEDSSLLRTALRRTIVPSAVQPCASGPRWAQFWGVIHTPHSLWVQPAGRPQVQVTSLLSCFLPLSYFLCILSSGSVSLVRRVHPHSFSGSQMTQVKAQLHSHFHSSQDYLCPRMEERTKKMQRKIQRSISHPWEGRKSCHFQQLRWTWRHYEKNDKYYVLSVILWSLKKSNAEKQRVECWLPETVGWGKGEKLIKGYKPLQH